MDTKKGTMPTGRQVLAVVSGNALEFYDFLSFSFFAVNVARVMFPVGEPGTALLMTLMTGSLGFFARPVGAVIFGLLGDRIGRKPSMLATFVLMGVGALGLALTPSYAQIGVAAPILVVAFRVIQGLAAGGDVGPTTAYLAERAPVEHRGVLTSLQLCAMRLGAAASGLVGLGLAAAMPPAMLDSLGWRLAFGIGAVIVPFAFLLRRRLDETLHLPEPEGVAVQRFHPLLYAGALLGVAGGLLVSSMGDFIVVTYAVTFLKTEPYTAYELTVAMGFVQAGAVVFAGWLSDRIGRRWVKLVPVLILLPIVWPLFHWVAETRSFLALCVTNTLGMGLVAMALAPAYVTLVEASPKRARSGLVGIGYGLVIASAFGIAPPIVLEHIRKTGDLASPAWVWMIGLAMLLVSAALVPETHPTRRRVTGPQKADLAGL